MGVISSNVQTASGPAVRFVTPVEVANEIATPAAEAMDAFNGNILATLASCQSEWLRFLGQRLQENLSMPARFASCRSMPEVQQVYMDYWNRTVDQYQDELQTLVLKVQQADGKPDLADRAEPRSTKPN